MSENYVKQPLPRDVVYDAIESHMKFRDRQAAAQGTKQPDAGEIIAQIAALCVQYMQHNGASFKE